MLLNKKTLIGIQEGSIQLAFRKWKRPTVKTRGTLLTPVGQLAIAAVDKVLLNDITEVEANAAGFSDLFSLRYWLSERADGDIYRVRLSFAGPDPRIALRENIPQKAELDEVVHRLERIDSRSTSGAWTRCILQLILQRPGEPAADLAINFGAKKSDFKSRVRQLKGLGLTESLRVGYRLSRRGKAVLKGLK